MKLADFVMLSLILALGAAPLSADDRCWQTTGHSSSTESPLTESLAANYEPVAIESMAADPEMVRRTNLEYSQPVYPTTQMGMCPPPCDPNQTWVLVAPYVWAPAQHGRIGARGVSAPIDVSLADLIDLIPDLNGAFMAHVEVGKGNKGLIFDSMLMKVEPSERGPNGAVFTLETSSTILETLAMYRMINIETDAATGSHWMVDLLGGARYYQVQNGIRINPPIGPTVQADLSKDWVDLVFGARTMVTVVPGIDGFLRADFGGFGIGTSSDLAWNLTTGIEYACESHPGTSLVLGYRILDISETQKSGPQQFLYNVKMQGPFMAIAFRF